MVISRQMSEQRRLIVVALTTELAVGVTLATVAVTIAQVLLVLCLGVGLLLSGKDVPVLQTQATQLQLVFCLKVHRQRLEVPLHYSAVAHAAT